MTYIGPAGGWGLLLGPPSFISVTSAVGHCGVESGFTSANSLLSWNEAALRHVTLGQCVPRRLPIDCWSPFTAPILPDAGDIFMRFIKK